MKIRNGLAPILIALSSFACGYQAPDLPTPYAPGSQLTQQQVEQFDNSGKCLDLGKIDQAVSQAQRSRNAIYDLRVVNDGTPVSFQFQNSVVDNTTLTQSPIRTNLYPRWQQTGCDSLSVVDQDGTTLASGKLSQATPTKIAATQITATTPGEPAQYAMVSFELIAGNRVRQIAETPYTTPHDKNSCGIGQENHVVHAESYLDFDQFLASAPAPSDAFAQLKSAYESYENPANGSLRKTRENQYCSNYQQH